MRVVGVAGWKNTGKTGLVERLVAEFSSRGLTVSTLKHAHHNFDVDQPGADSFRHRAAGAREVLVSSARRWALMHEVDGDEAGLRDLLAKLEPADIVIVEGFKKASLPKIETRRDAAGGPGLADDDANVICIASDRPATDSKPPEFLVTDTAAIADFVLQHVPAVRTGAEPQADAPGTHRRRGSAMPPGVDWIPVDSVLARIKESVKPAVGREDVPVEECLGRVLAEPVTVQRPSPPATNSAVDGYGFGFDGLTDDNCRLALLAGRAAAGAPWTGRVPSGRAVRVLTGAMLPDGVDSVVLEELTTVDGNEVSFQRPARKGLNTRAAGEDLRKGEALLAARRQLAVNDLFSLVAAGISRVPVYERLRVAVISTGDELVAAGHETGEHSILDANRPALLSLADRWGYRPVDKGLVKDDANAIRAVLDSAAEDADAILISGGASAGDEDHVSRLLQDEGELLAWRIAVKPGRPLALARWRGKPAFGLPGNPVAAFVCALVFARPALTALAGGGWAEPFAMRVPAAFEKDKKAGRREYIRAKLNEDGWAEAFHSEGSGLTTGLVWSNGLVELGDEAMDIRKGSPVRFISYGSFGL